MSRFSRGVVTLVAMCAATAPVVAAQGTWQVVLADSREHIALDTSRISQTLRGTTAWSRITLGREVPDPAGSYNAIEAENLYDCTAARFTTLRRVYLRNGQPVREEPAVRERSQTVLPGSIDEKLQAAACRAQPGQVVLAADEAGAAGALGVTGATASHVAVIGQTTALERPTTVPADYRTLSGDVSTARVMRVSDAAPVAEKPRMIELPKIDKEAASREAAAAGVSMPSAPAKAADIHGTAAAAGATAAAHGAVPLAKPVQPALAAPKTLPPLTAAPQPAVPARALPDIGVSGHARELMLATSGPKKKAKANPAEEMHVHWGYDGAGAPPNWGKLDPKNALCDNGKRQSPIDIRPGIAVDLEPIKFSYRPSKFTVVDNGHTIQVNVAAGNVINVMGKRFELAQFHFHKPSEERVNGRPFPMVIHFVHKDWDDNLAVIAVLLDEGAEHPILQTVWNHMPLESGSEVVAAQPLDVIKLMPDDRAYWTYMGSLTTPPCSENVLWMVMKTPIGVSPEQIGTFSRLYRHNARPIQPTNGRLVKETR